MTRRARAIVAQSRRRKARRFPPLPDLFKIGHAAIKASRRDHIDAGTVAIRRACERYAAHFVTETGRKRAMARLYEHMQAEYRAMRGRATR